MKSGVTNKRPLLVTECYVGNWRTAPCETELIFYLLYSVKIENYIHAVVLFVSKFSVSRFSWKLFCYSD